METSYVTPGSEVRLVFFPPPPFQTASAGRSGVMKWTRGEQCRDCARNDIASKASRQCLRSCQAAVAASAESNSVTQSHPAWPSPAATCGPRGMRSDAFCWSEQAVSLMRLHHCFFFFYGFPVIFPLRKYYFTLKGSALLSSNVDQHQLFSTVGS